MPLVRKPRGNRGRGGHHSEDDESTPICRCRVLYLGSAVPHITKDGLQGIQEPLKELYPDTGLSSLKGIDSWLSVWSNGLLLENVDEKNTKITRFFPIESLHYCAAVRNVLVPASSDGQQNGTSASTSGEKIQKFLPLDSPFARLPNLNHPPLFACILRRTTGIKVLECHAFICKREMAANALVRCCFHAYADSTYAKQLETNTTMTMTNGFSSAGSTSGGTLFKDPERQIQRSITPLNSIEKVNGWQATEQGTGGGASTTDEGDFTDGPVSTSTPRTNSNNKYEFSAEFPDEDEIYEGDENHKIWGGGSSGGGLNSSSTTELVYLEPDGTLKSIKSHSSRTMSKPRQFISPPPPPPPPPPAQQYSGGGGGSVVGGEPLSSKNNKKMKKKMKKEMSKYQMMYPPPHQGKGPHPTLMRPASMLNLSAIPMAPAPGRAGSVMNMPVSHNRPGSAMSTLTRGRPHPHHHPHMIPVPHPMMNGGGTLLMHPHHPHHPQPIYGHVNHHQPHPHHFLAPPPHLQMMKKNKNNKVSKSLSKKQQQMQMLTPVPLLAPTPLHPHHPMNATPQPIYHHHHEGGPPHSKSAGSSKLSPQGGGDSSSMIMMNHHHHHHHSCPPQYATIERGYHYRDHANRLKELGNGGPVMRNGDSATLTSTKSLKTKENGNNGNGGGSPINTGIYRKKGHLNERAFSYSIRQEHRSRSYGSLANLQFNDESGGGRGGGPEGVKKEREIIQMVRDLDLSGDEIERSQVPPEMYPMKNGNKMMMNGYSNGHGGNLMMVRPHQQQMSNGGIIPGNSHHPHHGPRITHR